MTELRSATISCGNMPKLWCRVLCRPEWAEGRQLRVTGAKSGSLTPAHHRAHRATDQGRPDQEGSDAMPQALRRSRGLQPPTARQNSGLTVHRASNGVTPFPTGRPEYARASRHSGSGVWHLGAPGAPWAVGRPGRSDRPRLSTRSSGSERCRRPGTPRQHFRHGGRNPTRRHAAGR